MLATLNLQLVTTDAGGESLPLQAFSPDGGATQVGGFAELLNVRVDTLQQPPVLDGQVLPPDGNKLPLPEPDIAITVDDLPVADPVSLAVPEIDMSGTPDIKNPPGIDLPKVDVDVSNEPLVTTIPPVAIPGPVTPAVPSIPTVAATPPADGADQLRDSLPAPRDLARVDTPIQQVEVRAAGTGERPVPIVLPGPVTDRQQPAPRQLAEAATSDGDASRLVETGPRQPNTPVAAPVLERLAEVMRSRVGPGKLAAAVTPHAQPAGFQPLPATNTLSEGNFASTLQQQATDLIRTPVMEPSWGDRIGERVVMLAGNQLKSAEIRLTPAELGPIRVQVSVDEGSTNVTFQATHAVTRDALEQALPRLREMLSENGLTLGQADVADQGVAQGNRDGDAESAEAGVVADDIDGLTNGIAPEERREKLVANGLVDTFA